MNSTEERTGGGNGAMQNSLCFQGVFKNDRIYYFGLASAYWKTRAHSYHEVARSRIDDVAARLLLRTNFLCLRIGRFLREVKCDFDVVLLSNSRLGYVAQSLRSRTRLLMTYYANIEVDFIRHKYRNRLLSLTDLLIFRRREGQCARLTDFSFFITGRDRDRHAALYGACKSAMLPVATPERKLTKKKGGSIRLVFFGSLSYPPNVSAVRYIVENILPRTEYPFLLAGSSPSDEVREMAKSGGSRIEFHPDFATLDGLLSDRDVFISPLAEGAGMKVKVADCLAMGLPILGSEENFVGYESMRHVAYLTCASSEDYLGKIREMDDPEKYAQIGRDLRHSWEEHFSMDASVATFAKALAALERT